MKNNQIRCLVERGASVKVVPWNYNFNKDEGKGLSNKEEGSFLVWLARPIPPLPFDMLSFRERRKGSSWPD